MELTLSEQPKVHRTIQIETFVAPDGIATCSTGRGSTCKFYELTRWGTSERCFWTKQEINRRDGKNGEGMGYTSVTEGCPVWGSYTDTNG